MAQQVPRPQGRSGDSLGSVADKPTTDGPGVADSRWWNRPAPGPGSRETSVDAHRTSPRDPTPARSPSAPSVTAPLSALAGMGSSGSNTT